MKYYEIHCVWVMYESHAWETNRKWGTSSFLLLFSFLWLTLSAVIMPNRFKHWTKTRNFNQHLCLERKGSTFSCFYRITYKKQASMPAKSPAQIECFRSFYSAVLVLIHTQFGIKISACYNDRESWVLLLTEPCQQCLHVLGCIVHKLLTSSTFPINTAEYPSQLKHCKIYPCP